MFKEALNALKGVKNAAKATNVAAKDLESLKTKIFEEISLKNDQILANQEKSAQDYDKLPEGTVFYSPYHKGYRLKGIKGQSIGLKLDECAETKNTL